MIFHCGRHSDELHWKGILPFIITLHFSYYTITVFIIIRLSVLYHFAIFYLLLMTLY